MLTLKLISEETERVVKGLEKKCFPNAREAVEKVLEYDRLRRETQQQLDANKQRQNQLSREIGGLMKSGKRDEANQVKEQVAQLKAADKALQEVMQKAQADMNEVLLTIPNIPTDEVPEGRDASSNVVVKEGGVKPDLPEGSLCHWDLLKKFNSTVSDGMILSMSEVENISPDDLKVDFPLVIVGARTTWGIVDHVTPDDVSAAAMAAGYLYDRGSTRLAVIGARDVYDEDALLNAVEGNAQLRLRGIIEETRRRGLSLDPQLIGNTDQDWTIGAGARVTQRLIDSGVPFDGVIALNDQLAIGALTALRTAGYEVPVQVQVIGFDNNEEAPYLQIPLTTMDSRLDWTAPTAVNRILGRIDGSITKSELLTTESQVIARASTR